MSSTLQRHLTAALALFAALSASGCLPYLYNDRRQVLINGIDIDQSLVMAERDLDDGGFGSVLTLWALRDQVVTPDQAAQISELYFNHIESVEREGNSFFNVWHLTWAISDLYRLGNEQVRYELEDAYRDAGARVADLDSQLATRFYSGDQIEMGDAHAFGRAFARSRLVVPGNDLYLQSVPE